MRLGVFLKDAPANRANSRDADDRPRVESHRAILAIFAAQQHNGCPMSGSFVQEPRPAVNQHISQTPPIFIAGDLAARRLVTVLDEWAPTPATGFFLYYPSRRQMRPALKALVDFLRKERRGVS